MVPVKGITAVVVLASCEGCDGYEIVLGDQFWDYQDKEFLSQSFIRERIQAPLRTSHALTQVLHDGQSISICSNQHYLDPGHSGHYRVSEVLDPGED